MSTMIVESKETEFTPVDPRTLKRFRLKGGPHIGPDYRAEPIVKNGRTQYPSKTYLQGDVVESPYDLVEKFENKFERMSNWEGGNTGPVSRPLPKGLDLMSISELAKVAHNIGVDVGSVNLNLPGARDEMIAVIRASRPE